jgi:hypothetical protein
MLSRHVGGENYQKGEITFLWISRLDYQQSTDASCKRKGTENRCFSNPLSFTTSNYTRLAASIRECLSDTLDRISDSYKIAYGGNTGAGNNKAFNLEFTCNHVTSPCYFDEEENNTCLHTNKPILERYNVWYVDKVSEILNPIQV